jgi:monoamine oxidase
MYMDCDVVVVGAGFAGLTAARRLVEGGLDTAVLEARDRVGGRTLNADLGGGKVVEVGGQWVGPTQDAVLALARELGVETFPTYVDGANRLEWRGRVRSYTGTIPRMNPAVLADVAQAQLRTDRMARRVPLEAPWQAPHAADWDGQTLESWLRRNVRTAGARELLTIGVEAVWAAQPGELSLLHALFYLHSGGGWSSLLDTRGGAQQDRFVGGSQRLALRMAAELGDRLRLSCPVVRIAYDDTGVTVTAATGETIRAGHAVVAVPPTLAGRIDYDPPLPAARDQLTQRVPMGAVTKCIAVYDEPFWRADGLSGQALSDRGPVRTIFDNSPPEGRPGVLLGFLEGRHARSWEQEPPDRRRDAVLDCFTRLFGPRAARPEHYLEQAWAQEPWSRGGYGGAVAPGAWTQLGPALRAPVGRLHWAGTETATRWNGYMDGAVRSGQRAAEEVLKA